MSIMQLGPRADGRCGVLVDAVAAVAEVHRTRWGAKFLKPTARLRYRGQIFFFLISSAIYSACRMARDTIVKVGFSAPPVVNWLPSEMNRFLTS